MSVNTVLEEEEKVKRKDLTSDQLQYDKKNFFKDIQNLDVLENSNKNETLKSKLYKKFDNNKYINGNEYQFEGKNFDITNNLYTVKPMSVSGEARKLKSKAVQMIIDVPVDKIKRFTNVESIGSVSKETQFFVGISTIHGPLRIFRGKGFYRFFWSILFMISVIFLTYQIITLFKLYMSHPTVSQLSFIIPSEGLNNPSVTICNYNPIRYSYIKELNKTKNFPKRLLDYMTMSFLQLPNLFSMSNKLDIKESHNLLINYTKYVNPNFSIHSFYYDAGFQCNDILKICAFGGKCYLLNLGKSKHSWLSKQRQSGINNGLLVIADYHTDEQIGYSEETAEESVFSNQFENGFRYYVHEDKNIPYLSTEGISISPKKRVYSAMSIEKRILLNDESWGNCSDKWPIGYEDIDIPYTSSSCYAICRAKYFIEKCGCTPMIYNVIGDYKNCLPYEILSCFLPNITNTNKTLNFVLPDLPACYECKADCESWQYNMYNSYGDDFSIGALTYLKQKVPTWTNYYILKNIVAINIFYREIGYTEFSQKQSTTFVEVLSNIGGNMGLFLGMSVLSVVEVIIYFCKILWLTISKRRRNYIKRKKEIEEEKARQLEETLENFKRHNEDMKRLSMKKRLNKLTSRFASSFHKRSNNYAQRLNRYVSNIYPISHHSLDNKNNDPPKSYLSSFEDNGIEASVRKTSHLVEDIVQQNLFGVGRTQICTPDKDGDEILRIDIDLNKFQDGQLLKITDKSINRSHSLHSHKQKFFRNWKRGSIALPLTISSRNLSTPSDCSNDNTSQTIFNNCQENQEINQPLILGIDELVRKI
ncbi:Na+ channel, amiloride-sensitive family-containing protein [Strongyloides ratti]|uniref:Na+ channel, amiloride-sensitive family-containing protein n=1 Tax=Strongyloides ratti TaxID=34506 RepID=A0A090MZ02_STRRB|nr:Na+ channel, amiloride-sensitive family-containing protein [Strongyloides ratti]CEF68079.1 Na+ channel, amiloride-sensitive family-containing protein [Strongyloides ratti]